MGGKSSKLDVFTRTTPTRKSQSHKFHKIDKKLVKVTKQIDKFNGKINDANYMKIKAALTDIIDDLEKISSVVKDKYKNMYQDILTKCNDEMEKLDDKVKALEHSTSSRPQSPLSDGSSVGTPSVTESGTPIESPMSQRSTRSVELKLVKLALENDAKERRTARDKKRNKSIDEEASASTPEPENSFQRSQSDAVERIDKMRKQIENLNEEIHIYKEIGDRDLYVYIKDNLSQIIAKLDNMENYGNIQIKHERKLALQRAQECLKYLNDDSGTKKKITVEMHENSTVGSIELEEVPKDINLSSKSITYTRPITLDLNENDQLKEELHKIIHKRMADATEDTDAEKLKSSSSKNIGEEFYNTESEEDFDFVNDDVEEEGGKKLPPVLVTSF